MSGCSDNTEQRMSAEEMVVVQRAVARSEAEAEVRRNQQDTHSDLLRFHRRHCRMSGRWAAEMAVV